MTFQVGLIGTDGMILASDKRITRVDATGADATSRGRTLHHGGTSAKITCNEQGSIIYCAAGGHLGEAIAREYMKAPVEGDIGKELLAARERVESNNPAFSEGELLLAQIVDGRAGLWHMDVRPGVWSAPHRVEDKVQIGDAGNLAAFFVEMYAPTPLRGLRTVVELKFLAAHSIRVAGLLNPAFVGDLEMWIHRTGQECFIQVEDDEIRTLISRSDALTEELSSKLFSISSEDLRVAGFRLRSFASAEATDSIGE